MHERHADPIDEANAMAATLTEGGIAAARLANAPEKHPDFDGESCIECGDTIPEDRLKLEKIRCIRCQSNLETRQKQQFRSNWGGSPSWPSAD